MSDQWYCPQCGPIKTQQVYRDCAICHICKKLCTRQPAWLIAMKERTALLEAEVAALCKADIKRIPTRDTRIRELKAENQRLRDAMQKMSAALGRIDYLMGAPNDMEVSGYHLHCDEREVVATVEKRIALLEAELANERSQTTPYWLRQKAEDKP
jgi:hypothetical protein